MSTRILLVDDEADIRFTIGMLLRSRGYKVAEAENGRVALERLEQDDFDLVILDNLMPEMDGLEVLKALPESRGANTPVIMLTAKGTDKDVREGYRQGAANYITKPFKNSDLLTAIRELLTEGETS